MKTGILILAAGTSSRMKTPKQLLPYKNTTLLGRTIEQAINSDAENVFCVLGANKNLIEEHIKNYDIELIFNPDFEQGLSTSIVNGIKHIEKTNFDNILILLADQPFIESVDINKILKLSKENPNYIIASKYPDKIGVPTLFPKQYFNELKSLKGGKGAGYLLNTTQDIITVSSLNLTDIDTIQEYNSLVN